jgi:hypothetical protein
MSPIIVDVATLSDIISLGVVDEIFDLLAVFLILFGLVFVLDFGFDIEES